VRLIGVLAAFGLLGLIAVLPRGAELNLPFVTVGTRDPNDPGRSTDSVLNVATFLLAGFLAWLFADSAVRPGWRSGLATALRLPMLALVFVVAIAWVAFVRAVARTTGAISSA
jgi:hypothetical protein